MPKKKKEESRLKTDFRVHQSGYTFPEDEADASTDSSSGNEIDTRSSKSRKKVKSGEKVKRRSVVKTELWPHTLANEDDGEDTTSENIMLYTFLKYN